jgi:hypothetical protein
MSDDKKPAPESLSEALKRAGFKERPPTGRGVVIPAAPAPKKGDAKKG